MKHNKIGAGDTIKNITKEPKEALKADYHQTKADMKNMKDATENKIDETKNDVERK